MTENHAADLYDAVNLWGPSDDFFLDVATALPRARLLDLGCGTGGLTITAARAGCSVTGIDPDRPSLAAARAKPGAGLVEWIDGDSRRISHDARFDVVLLTSNVVQEILDDGDLARTFRDVAAHLVPGGRLAFDSRDPDARGWEAWTKERTHKVVHLPEGDTRHWYQTVDVDEQSGLVDFCSFEVGPDGAEHVERGPLRFRSEALLRDLLGDAGLSVDAVFGGYRGEPVGRGTGVLAFSARH